MITRIKIDGFKSLHKAELFFGPFTCIAGANAIGKSNFFDALLFLSKLADNTVLQAARSIRSESQNHADVRDLFFRYGDQNLKDIEFEVDMIVSREATDDLGQTAKAAITSLRYTLHLRLQESDNDASTIGIVKEELQPIALREARRLHFRHSQAWKASVIQGRRTSPFISTQGDKIMLHQEAKGKGGRSSEYVSSRMPRTLLSTVTAESPTAFLARYEMRHWMMLQFEPSALRQPSSIFEVKNASITAGGENLPATLYRLNAERETVDVYQQLTNRLRELVEDVREIKVDRDDKRDLLTVLVKFRDGMCLPAQSLSDGTLRFLGLAVLEADSARNSVICLEEPENGINPKRVGEMTALLEDMAVDAESADDEYNPFRQVMVNTHSPLVVQNIPEDSLYFARSKEVYLETFKKKVQVTDFIALPHTWKTDKADVGAISKGDVLAYLEHERPAEILESAAGAKSARVNGFTSRKTAKEHMAQLTLSAAW